MSGGAFEGSFFWEGQFWDWSSHLMAEVLSACKLYIGFDIATDLRARMPCWLLALLEKTTARQLFANYEQYLSVHLCTDE